jgi:hypothetical protein
MAMSGGEGVGEGLSSEFGGAFFGACALGWVESVDILAVDGGPFEHGNVDGGFEVLFGDVEQVGGAFTDWRPYGSDSGDVPHVVSIAGEKLDAGDKTFAVDWFISGGHKRIAFTFEGERREWRSSGKV